MNVMVVSLGVILLSLICGNKTKHVNVMVVSLGVILLSLICGNKTKHVNVMVVSLGVILLSLICGNKMNKTCERHGCISWCNLVITHLWKQNEQNM